MHVYIPRLNNIMQNFTNKILIIYINKFAKQNIPKLNYSFYKRLNMMQWNNQIYLILLGQLVTLSGRIHTNNVDNVEQNVIISRCECVCLHMTECMYVLGACAYKKL